MPEQDTGSEKAMEKVNIDLKATKAKAPESKKSVEFAVPHNNNVIVQQPRDVVTSSSPLIQPPPITNGTLHQVCSFLCTVI